MVLLQGRQPVGIQPIQPLKIAVVAPLPSFALIRTVRDPRRLQVGARQFVPAHPSTVAFVTFPTRTRWLQIVPRARFNA